MTQFFEHYRYLWILPLGIMLGALHQKHLIVVEPKEIFQNLLI